MEPMNLVGNLEDPPFHTPGAINVDGCIAHGKPSLRVLIIDDEIRQDDVLVLALSVEGVEGRCAQTGRLGLALARTLPFDAILLDLKLPDILGLTVLSELRRDRIAVPVLAVTGWFLSADHQRHALELGAGARPNSERLFRPERGDGVAP